MWDISKPLLRFSNTYRIFMSQLRLPHFRLGWLRFLYGLYLRRELYSVQATISLLIIVFSFSCIPKPLVTSSKTASETKACGLWLSLLAMKVLIVQTPHGSSTEYEHHTFVSITSQVFAQSTPSISWNLDRVGFTVLVISLAVVSGSQFLLTWGIPQHDVANAIHRCWSIPFIDATWVPSMASGSRDLYYQCMTGIQIYIVRAICT